MHDIDRRRVQELAAEKLTVVFEAVASDDHTEALAVISRLLAKQAKNKDGEGALEVLSGLRTLDADLPEDIRLTCEVLTDTANWILRHHLREPVRSTQDHQGPRTHPPAPKCWECGIWYCARCWRKHHG